MTVLRRVLRALLLSLLFAFAVGLGVGTWLRCRMERPPSVIGDASERPIAATRGSGS